MFELRLPNILVFCSIIVCIGLTGCAYNKDKVENSEKQPSKSTETNVTDSQVTSSPPTDTAQSEPIDIPSKDNTDIIDYDQYLKKIWVVKNWNGEEYDYPSFYITKIENGVIEGKI
jgi:hypothetical protein